MSLSTDIEDDRPFADFVGHYEEGRGRVMGSFRQWNVFVVTYLEEGHHVIEKVVDEKKRKEKCFYINFRSRAFS